MYWNNLVPANELTSNLEASFKELHEHDVLVCAVLDKMRDPNVDPSTLGDLIAEIKAIDEAESTSMYELTIDEDAILSDHCLYCKRFHGIEDVLMPLVEAFVGADDYGFAPIAGPGDTSSFQARLLGMITETAAALYLYPAAFGIADAYGIEVNQPY